MKAGRVKGGSIIPAVIGAGRQFRSNMAQPVFNAAGMTRGLKGGSARKIIEITSDDLVQNGGQYKLMGGPAVPMQIVTDRAEKGGAAQVVYPVDMLGNYDPSFAGYIYKVLTADEDSGYDPTSLIGFWPQNELSGAVSIDHSGLGHDGAYTAVDLGQPGIPGIGMTSAGYDGAASVNNIYSASFNAAFNGSEGTAIIWPRVTLAAWTDGAARRFLTMAVDLSNVISMRKGVANNQLQFFYFSGVSTLSINEAGVTTLDHMPIAMTWSSTADEMKVFRGAVQVGATQNGLGVWAGNLLNTETVIGAQTTAPGQPFLGSIGPCAIFTSALSQPAIAYLSTP